MSSALARPSCKAIASSEREPLDRNIATDFVLDRPRTDALPDLMTDHLVGERHALKSFIN
jgi:hypothetical protein